MNLNEIKKLKEITNLSLSLCKKAYIESNSDIIVAKDLLLNWIDDKVKLIQSKTNESYETSIKALNLYGNAENAIIKLNEKKYFFYNLTYEDLFAIDLKKYIPEITIKDSILTDKHLEKLSNIKTLNSIFFVNTTVDNNGLIHITKLSNLKSLSFIYSNISDVGLKNISNMSIRYLALIYVDVSRKGLIHIKSFKNLDSLELSSIEIKEEDIELFKDTKLDYIEFWNSFVDNVFIEKMRSIKQNCTINLGEWQNDGYWRPEP